MSQAILSSSNLCSICTLKPLYVKSRGLCVNCYQRLRLRNDLPPKTPKSNHERKKKLRQNLIKKHGLQIIDDFRDLDRRPFWNLVNIGNKYGFSREYARQIYTFLFGKPYRAVRTKKTRKRKKEMLTCSNDPRHKAAEYKTGNHKKAAQGELLFYNKCKKLNLNVELLCDRSIDIKVNGFLIDVKTCHSPRKYHPSQKELYYRFSVSKKQMVRADFIACYHVFNKSFYIIPIEKASPGRSIYISREPSTHWAAINRYEPYKDAWYLLSHNYPKKKIRKSLTD